MNPLIRRTVLLLCALLLVPAPEALASRERPLAWKSPEVLVRHGFERSRVVMMNEAHSAMTRCRRTREVGRQAVKAAAKAGVRYLAMEAVGHEYAAKVNLSRQAPAIADPLAYLGQPEMRALVQAALDAGMLLVPYDHRVQGIMDREEAQAHNLVEALNQIPPDAKMLVWSGNSHMFRLGTAPQRMMGYHFEQRAGFRPFYIDQIGTVRFPGSKRNADLNALIEKLPKRTRTAGMLMADLPDRVVKAYGDVYDAMIVSRDNELE